MSKLIFKLYNMGENNDTQAECWFKTGTSSTVRTVVMMMIRSLKIYNCGAMIVEAIVLFINK